MKITTNIPDLGGKSVLRRKFLVQGSLSRSFSAKLVACGLVSCLLSACSSALGLGESKYGCSGMPRGVRCMSTREVYTLTNESGAVLPHPARAAESTAQGSAAQGSTPRGSTARASATENAAGKAPFGADGRVSDIDPGPLPVRTPSRIMRIWVAPYQDTLGDLVTGQYVYTEIEGRKWSLGQKVAVHERGLRPLQRRERQQLQSKPGRQGKTGRTVNSPTRTGK